VKTLKNYIVEQKNTHMTHVEDLVFDGGVDGTRQAIKFLQDLRDMLAGNSKTKITATVKWDGAPAVFAGIDPTDKKFFVAKKGVFNKNPIVYKTNAEIDADTSGDLAAKLKVALAEFKKLGIKSGVYQGDLMFTDDKKIVTIDGQKYVTFHPNTIVYAVPVGTELANKIMKAKIGVVWHTTYTGSTFESMTASFGKSIVSKMTQSASVWMDDANYKDYSGTATFTQEQTKELTAILSQAGTLFSSIPAATLNAIKDNEDLNMAVNTYNNSKVRAGGKAGKEEKRKAVLSFFATHDKAEIVKIFDLVNLLAKAKLMIITKMNDAGHINTFLKTTSGYKVTGVEGFVAIDHLTGGAVKIVDRLEFSKSNFSADIIKGWQR